MKTASAIPLFLALLLSVGSPRETRPFPPADTSASAYPVSWEPAQLVNGSPCLFRVSPPETLQSLTGSWLGHQVLFDFDPASGTWYGVAGVSLDTAPGSYQLALEGVTLSGKKTAFNHTIAVGKAAYRTAKLRASKRFIDPDPEALERIKREQELKRAILEQFTAQRTWSGPFIAPVAAVTTEQFGTRRILNRGRHSVHRGLDYRAAVGTPVAAMNHGRVVLARHLFFEGNCVVLDHGQGLRTFYLHLAEIKVAEGEKVVSGQMIGLSGATGLVTGPHLHVAVSWRNMYLDPATLLKLELP